MVAALSFPLFLSLSCTISFPLFLFLSPSGVLLVCFWFFLQLPYSLSYYFFFLSLFLAFSMPSKQEWRKKWFEFSSLAALKLFQLEAKMEESVLIGFIFFQTQRFSFVCLIVNRTKWSDRKKSRTARSWQVLNFFSELQKICIRFIIIFELLSQTTF